MPINKLEKRREEVYRNLLKAAACEREDLQRKQRWEEVEQSFSGITRKAHGRAAVLARSARIRNDIHTVMALRRLGLHKEANARRLSSDSAAHLRLMRRLRIPVAPIVRV